MIRPRWFAPLCLGPWLAVFAAPMSCAGQPAPARQETAPPEAAAAPLSIDQPDGLTDPASGVIPNATVRLDRKTREIRRVEGAIAMPGAATPADAAAAFLESFLRLPVKPGAPTQLLPEPDSSRHTLSGAIQTYQLHYTNTDDGERLPMPGNVVIVRLDPDNRIVSATNDTVAVTNPIKLRADGISASQATEAVRQLLAGRQQEASMMSEPRRVVLVSDGTPAVFWQVRAVTRTPPASLRLLVDARTGRVVSTANVAAYQAH